MSAEPVAERVATTFPEGVVAFRAVRAGIERDQLLAVAAELETGLGYEAVAGKREDGAPQGIARRSFAEMLSEEDVHLIEAITAALARVASAVGQGQQLSETPNAIEGAIDGAEMVMWGELVRGSGASKLAAMLPGFVFLVVLPLVGREEALRISERVGELLEGGGAGKNGS